MQENQLAAGIVEGIIQTGIEGTWGDVARSTKGDYPSPRHIPVGRRPSGWPPPPYPRRQPIRRKDIQRTQTDRSTETPFVHSFQYSRTKGPEKRTHRRRQSIREIPPPGAPFPKSRMYNLRRHVVPHLHQNRKTFSHQSMPRLRFK